MEKRTEYIILSLCISSKCNRGCSHCFVNGNMEGTFFSLEKALCLSREIHRITKLFSKKIDLQFEIDLTGEGEALLNPEMVDILDIIMGLNNNVTCFLVTSGVNSESI